jgi:hypothetical protein
VCSGWGRNSKINFISYGYSRKIGKSNNLNVFGSKWTKPLNMHKEDKFYLRIGLKHILYEARYKNYKKMHSILIIAFKSHQHLI